MATGSIKLAKLRYDPKLMREIAKLGNYKWEPEGGVVTAYVAEGKVKAETSIDKWVKDWLKRNGVSRGLGNLKQG